MTDTKPQPPVPDAPSFNVFGRPREYDAVKTVEKSLAYLEAPRSITGKVKIPTIEGLASYLKISKNTIYEWKKIYPDFSDVIDELMLQQASSLIENGLDGAYNSTITKLMLGKHGYKDQSDITTNDKDITAQDKAAADVAIDNFLTKKTDGPAANTTNKESGKDTATVQIPTPGK